jgi:hypothetical protein
LGWELTSGGVVEATVASETNLVVLVPIAVGCLAVGGLIGFSVKKIAGRVHTGKKELHEPLELDHVELMPPPT